MEFVSAALIAFGVVMLVELPDKTLVASLVLSARFQPRAVVRRVPLRLGHRTAGVVFAGFAVAALVAATT
jgi:putative Ca2+/H+ antiporter (TMEM165/GDT1 family)